MRQCLVLAGIAIGLAGCFLDYDGPSREEIEASLAEHRASFDELEAMLRADERCRGDADTLRAYAIEVGVDKVCDFWKHGRLWDAYGMAEGKPIQGATEEEMLEAVGISPRRYERYLELLDHVGAKRAQLYQYGSDPAVPTYFLGGAGMVTSSYYVNVVRVSEPPEDIVEDVFDHIEEEGYGTYAVYSKLGGDWYIEMDMMW